MAYSYLASAFLGMAVTRLRRRGGAVTTSEKSEVSSLKSEVKSEV
jgi:hypothetical protein